MDPSSATPEGGNPPNDDKGGTGEDKHHHHKLHHPPHQHQHIHHNRHQHYHKHHKHHDHPYHTKAQDPEGTPPDESIYPTTTGIGNEKPEPSVSSTTVKSNNNGTRKKKKNGNSLQPASFRSLFQFAERNDIITFAVGVLFCILSSATMPAINIVFGDIVDSIANPIEVGELVNQGVRAMIVLGVYGMITFFLSFLFCGFAATNIANGFRMQYLNSLLSQEMEFFDNAEPGSLTLMMSDSAMAIQAGLSDKLAQAIQGFFQFLFGFAIAFYFGPILSLVLLGFVPFMGIIMSLLFAWGSEDGLFGKEAYEQASEIANEAISNIRTVVALNAEPKMSRRYDSKLGIAEKAAIRQGLRVAFLVGCLFFVMFAMYGLGLWFGAVLIARSTEDAMEDYPPPEDLLDPEGPWYETIVSACGQYLDNLQALEVCACGLPWQMLTDIPSPNCGCGYASDPTAEELGLGVVEGCVSGGRTILVFFSILVGGFSIGQISPGVKAMSEARLAAAKMLQVINRKPKIGDDDDEEDKSENKEGNKKKKKRLKREDVNGEITLKDVDFYYSRSPPRKSESSEGTDDDSEKEEIHDHIPRPVFTGCNLTIKPGQTVALVGESGCGKSTIAKLVQRFYDPTEGQILLDGTDLKEIKLFDLRSCIGVVSQEPILFDNTIENNIRYGKPDANFEEIVEAAKSANAHDFIMSFPNGYQTIVGQKGGKLSGGQKQRYVACSY